MLKMVASSLDCWQQHMGLDNGTDPEGIKVRPAAGLGAADFLFPGASSTVPASHCGCLTLCRPHVLCVLVLWLAHAIPASQWHACCCLCFAL